MTLKTRFLAAAALTLPALAGAQPPTPTPPASPPAATQPPRPGTMPPAPPSTTTPPTQQPTDATETRAQQPANDADDPPAQQSTQTPPPATMPPAATPPATTPPGAQAQTTPPSTVPPGALVNATAADLRAGAQVHDQHGGLVGTIESPDATGAVVNTGTARGRLALNSFGRNSQGLVIAMTKTQLEAAIAAAAPGPSAATTPGTSTPPASTTPQS